MRQGDGCGELGHVGVVVAVVSSRNMQQAMRRQATVKTAFVGAFSPERQPLNATTLMEVFRDDEGEIFPQEDLPRALPLEYQVHAGAGAPCTGELHCSAAGAVAGQEVLLDSWQLEYQKRLANLGTKLRGWQPSLRASVASTGKSASLRWSKALLPDDEAPSQQPDGTGLDLHFESSLKADKPQSLSKVENEWEQRAEVVIGPRAQAKYLNFSLPVGVALGAVFSSRAQPGDGASQATLPWRPKFFAELSWPGLYELRGWLVEAQTLHRRIGALSGQARRAWRSKADPSPPAQWALTHFKQHPPFRLPNAVGNSMDSASSFLRDRLTWLRQRSDPWTLRGASRPAVMPATKLRIGSDGPSALLGLQSAEAGLGGSGFESVVEVSRLGWGAKLAVALGIADQGFGQPRYAVTASGAWHNSTSLMHELKWMLSEGQWAGVTFQNGGPGRSRYEVKNIIGSGSYGSVCEAYDKERDQNVAIKRVKHMFDDLVDCKRILRETAIMTRLTHPHIVQIYDIIEPSHMRSFDELYIVMELCDSDMKKLIKTDVLLTPLHINTLLYNLLVGLKYLHSAGIWHRDLKPANCLVNQDCSVKICDFGLSRAVSSVQHAPLPNTPRGEEEPNEVAGPVVPHTAKAKRTMTRHVVTRWYRAPELILLQDNYNEQIDMWSVGCIYAELLQMLEGTHTEDRGPLFPGSSCYPLSPDRKHRKDPRFHTSLGTDQLNVIFDLLGTPSEAEIAQLQTEEAKQHIRALARRERKGVRSRFPDAPDASVDLLEKMLKFTPRERVNVDLALDHELFKDIRDRSVETVALGT
ncbi:NTF4 [Symbiodinium natans]|uniref:Mitogen-activated protein kinase n=1 Tax=Symbiodinium natans TaxID=878477 RepID=A0A812JFF5_9DINO|nr:NTF4 [Symbiodinium natans]